MTPASTALRRMSALRMRLVDLHPFWGHLLLHVRLVPQPGMPAIAATDCVRTIWFDPARVAGLTDEELGFVLTHEVGHHVLASAERRRWRDPHVWNCATDYAINRIVAAFRHPADDERPLWAPPDGALLDPRYDGMVAEAIYERLLAERVPLPSPVPVAVALDGGPRLDGVADHGGGIDVHLPVSLGEEDRDALRARIAGAVEAWEQAGRRGDVPADVLRGLHPTGRPRVPWQHVLRQFVGQAARDDWSLAHPSRRWLAQGLLVPGPSSERAGRVVVALDTSGSMTGSLEIAARLSRPPPGGSATGKAGSCHQQIRDLARSRSTADPARESRAHISSAPVSPAQLDAVATELAALSREVEELTLLVADSAVREVVPPAEVDRFLRHGQARGGGGTDHRPVFAWLRAHGTPDLFVGLTDLYSRFPDRPPPCPVLWVTPERHGAAPWGRVVTLS